MSARTEADKRTNVKIKNKKMNKELQARTAADSSTNAELLPSANLAQNTLLAACGGQKESQMSNDEIKKECELMYKQIKDAESRLKELRSSCKHENTFEGNYSYRIGSVSPAIICSDCGQMIKYK